MDLKMLCGTTYLWQLFQSLSESSVGSAGSGWLTPWAKVERDGNIVVQFSLKVNKDMPSACDHTELDFRPKNG